MILSTFICLVIVFFYPYVIFPVGLVFLQKIIKKSESLGNGKWEGELPEVSLIVSAYNEEKVIQEKIENALCSKYPSAKLQIIVASDGSTDGTADIARSYSQAGVVLMHSDTRRGKNACLNAAVGMAKGQIIAFTDANAMFDDMAIQYLVDGFDSEKVGCVVGKERRSAKKNDGTSKSDGVYWRFENWIKEALNRFGLVIVGNGPILAVRRELFRPLSNDVANDFETPMQIGNSGWRVIFQDKALSFENSATKAQEEYRRKTRIVVRGLTGFSRNFSDLRGARFFVFVSHKVIRWFGAFLQFAILVLSLLILDEHPWFASVALGAQFIFYLLAAAGAVNLFGVRKSKYVAIPFYFCMVNLAAAVAICRFTLGVRVSVWEKAASVRQ
ncbi:glycosyltransferase family 2 protein [Paraburkholderia sp. BL6669N2]|uniref:glycosyltransferase family 2 protein n=1 Tax=Paraburkholderia sp. BL6669N2 TaxID=1938807 RepID=UPI0015F2742D|nr:glycosyltransferase family 2 protein [Paraburkholderia sp. BL6669N2]